MISNIFHETYHVVYEEPRAYGERGGRVVEAWSNAPHVQTREILIKVKFFWFPRFLYWKGANKRAAGPWKKGPIKTILYEPVVIDDSIPLERDPIGIRLNWK